MQEEEEIDMPLFEINAQINKSTGMKHILKPIKNKLKTPSGLMHNKV